MSATGCVSRTIADTALWLDVTSGNAPGDVDRPPPPDRPYREAAAAPPGRLRIAVSLKPWRSLAPPIVSEEVKGGVEATARLLESLGHEVYWRDPDYGLVGNQITTLYLSGIRRDFDRLPKPERAMKQTRGIARLGGLYPRSLVAAGRRRRDPYAERINRLFDDFDVLLTGTAGLHTHEHGRWGGKGGLATVLGMSRVYCFNAVWNYTGNPAAAVPAGFARDGMPLSVQLVGRPNDEATLLSLSAQLEAELDWPGRRPPVS
jgi:amidase